MLVPEWIIGPSLPTVHPQLGITRLSPIRCLLISSVCESLNFGWTYEITLDLMYDKRGTLFSGYEIEPRAQPWPNLDKISFPESQIQQLAALCNRMNCVLFGWVKLHDIDPIEKVAIALMPISIGQKWCSECIMQSYKDDSLWMTHSEWVTRLCSYNSP